LNHPHARNRIWSSHSIVPVENKQQKAMLKSLLICIGIAVLFASSNAQTSTGNITMVFTPNGGNANPITFQCSNGRWTAFGLTITVQVYVNGVGPLNPMTETGLPTIQMQWFKNGNAVSSFLLNPFNVGNPTNGTNVTAITYSLLNDQGSIGGTFQVGMCLTTQTQPPITVNINTNTFVTGTGVAGNTPAVPAVSGVPFIVNNFNAANNAGGTLTATAAPTTAPTAAPTTAPTVAPTTAPTAAPTSATGGSGGSSSTSAPTQAAQANAQSATTKKLTQGQIVGIAAGGAGAAVVLAASVFLIRRYKKRRPPGTLLGSQEKVSLVNAPYINI
jgi:hypothetical protein